MFRNFFALFSTIMLGASVASASTGDAAKPPLSQRIQVAQKKIYKLMDIEKDQASKPYRYRVARKLPPGITGTILAIGTTRRQAQDVSRDILALVVPPVKRPRTKFHLNCPPNPESDKPLRSPDEKRG